MRSGRPHHDCVLLHLLRIGEYTTKGTHNNCKQTEKFKMGDITFFAKDKQGNLCCLPRNATSDLIAVADGATMKLDNQKNGWKGVCVYQESNGDPINCPVRALGRHHLHLRANGATKTTIILSYFNEGRRYCNLGSSQLGSHAGCGSPRIPHYQRYPHRTGEYSLSAKWRR